jgi:hypothetical protein
VEGGGSIGGTAVGSGTDGVGLFSCTGCSGGDWVGASAPLDEQASPAMSSNETKKSNGRDVFMSFSFGDYVRQYSMQLLKYKYSCFKCCMLYCRT